MTITVIYCKDVVKKWLQARSLQPGKRELDLGYEGPTETSLSPGKFPVLP